MFYAGPLIPEQAELPTSTFIDQVVRVFHIDIRDLGDALDQVLPRSQSYFMGTISSVFFSEALHPPEDVLHRARQGSKDGKNAHSSAFHKSEQFGQQLTKLRPIIAQNVQLSYLARAASQAPCHSVWCVNTPSHPGRETRNMRFIRRL